MLRRRAVRLALLVGLIALGAALAVVGVTREADGLEGTPMDVEWVGDHGYATLAEGEIVRLRVSDDRVEAETVASGLRFPRGLAVHDGTVYVAELGDLPCENPVPRCKGEHVGPTIAEGERRLLDESSGRVLAYPIVGDGLGEPETLVDGLRFVNSDHGLNDLEVGPDGALYLAVGNLDELAWRDPDLAPDPSEELLIGSILRIDPATGAVERHVRGIRNVYGLAFDASGTLWGVDNDGRGRGVWRHEELLRLEAGEDHGFPVDGTVGPYERRTAFATWIMPTGAGSSGLLVEDGTVISGACGRVTHVRLDEEGGDAAETQVRRPGCVTAVVRLPDDRLLLATVLGDAPFSVLTEAALFDQ